MTTQVAERESDGRWKKGASGNPGGRPREIAELKTLARQHSEAAIAQLVRLMHHAESDAAKVAACKEILDRAYGKAVQSHEMSGIDGNPIQIEMVEVEEAKRRAREIMASAIAEQSGSDDGEEALSHH